MPIWVYILMAMVHSIKSSRFIIFIDVASLHAHLLQLGDYGDMTNSHVQKSKAAITN